jgi:eukaryotic-like serine/threonine-protein kinase
MPANQNQIGVELHGQKGCYLIESEIARGGMGAVYQARNIDTNCKVAIKEICMDPEICKDFFVPLRERVVDEMKALASLDHPNIPPVYDQFSERHHEYMVMEFISGSTLMQIQQRALGESKLLGESRVFGWALQVLDTLIYLHELPNPIIHRDLKPENLILDPDGKVMLIDFGLMTRLEQQALPEISHYQAAGTIEYAPPELYGGVDWGISPQTDLYSLGAVSYYLLTGVLPPRALDRIIPGTVNITYKLPSIRDHNSTVSAHSEQVIFKALEIDPDRRFGSARQMREAILPPRSFIPLPF